MMRTLRPGSFLLVALMATGHSAWSQGKESCEITKGADPGIRGAVHPLSTCKDGLPLEKFISWASIALDTPFLWSDEAKSLVGSGMPGKSARSVKLTKEMNIPEHELPDYVRTILHFHGLALIPLGLPGSRFLLITRIQSSTFSQAKKTIVLAEDLEQYKDTYIPIITTIHVEYMDVSKIQVFLQPLMQLQGAVPGHRLIPLPSENAFVIIDFGPNAYAIARLIKEMDRQGYRFDQTLVVYQLDHTSACEMESMLSGFLEQEEERRNNPQHARRVDRIPPQPKIIPREQSNQLAILATAADHGMIQSLIEKLDTPMPATTGNFLVYMLKNSVAEDLVATLKEAFEVARGRSRTGRGGPSQGSLSTATGEGKVTIVADKGSNALLIGGTRSRIKEVVEMVKKLDIRKPQVLVEAAIIEIQHSDTMNLGVELGAFDSKVDLADTFRPFGYTNLGVGAVTLTENGPVRVPNPGSQGVVGGIFDGDGFLFPVLIQAFQARGNTNLLSMPSILTNDHEEAVITVQRSVPVAQLNQGTVGQVTTTTYDKYADAPIKLSISPHIASENYLRLDIDFEIVMFGVSSGPGLPPPKTIRNVSTSVTVHNGATVVLGGLTLDEQTESINQVPVLGDIPLLGALFRSNEIRHTKNTLFLFLTPRILSDPTFRDLDEISTMKKAEAAALGGQIDLVDPETGRRIRMLEKTRTIKDIEATGAFDVPVLYSPTDEEEQVEGE